MEGESSLVWALLLFGLVVAGGFGWLWRRADQRAAGIAAELEKERSALSEARSDATREKKARERLSDELSGYRRKADKTKRRQAKTSQTPLGTSSRIQDLEEGLDQLRREGERFRLERDHLDEENRRLDRALETLRSELAREKEKARPDPATPGQTASAAAPSPSEDAGTELAEATERVSKLENELGIARETEARMRKRMETQDQLYASVRAELDVKKDRLRTQEEQIQRLQALEVALSSE